MVLADGDEFHLGRDDALAGVPELGDRVTFAGAQRLAALAEQAGEFDEAVLLRLAGELGVLPGEIAVVHRLHFPPLVGRNVAAFQNPVPAQGGQAFARICR